MKLQILNNKNEVLNESLGNEIICVYNEEYKEGDKIVFTCDTTGFYMIQLDDTISESLVYIKEGELIFPVPFENERNCYSPKSFSGDVHVLTVRKASLEEYNAYRNVALNRFDFHTSTNCFPHSSANVETRGESKFASKNVINGNKANASHGNWPYESWGINKDPKAILKIDFGREVEVDKAVIYLRADFPHDSHWTEGTIKFSDNTKITFELKKTNEGQIINFPNRKITSLELCDLKKADDESEFPALSQIEVYGV